MLVHLPVVLDQTKIQRRYRSSGHHRAHHIVAKHATVAGMGIAGAGCQQGGTQMLDPVSCCNMAGWHASACAQGKTHSPALT